VGVVVVVLVAGYDFGFGFGFELVVWQMLPFVVELLSKSDCVQKE
jgi:hypothetical protein